MKQEKDEIKERADIQNIRAVIASLPHDTDETEAKKYWLDFRKLRQKGVFRKQIIHWMKYAAIFIGAVIMTGGFIYYYMFYREDTTYCTLSVPAGQRAQITLADGTKIWLNSQSTLVYPGQFSGNTREVTLEGEAYFNVTRQNGKSFVVKTKNFDIQVFGTEFNVSDYSNNSLSEVSLLKGSVAVKQIGSSQIYKMKENGKVSIIGDKLVSVKVDEHDDQIAFESVSEEKTVVEKKKLFVSEIQDYDYYKWKDGIISFNNETVDNILKKVELYYDIKIKIDEKSPLLTLRYSGKFRTRDGVEQIIKVLQLEHKFSYTRDNELNIITIK